MRVFVGLSVVILLVAVTPPFAEEAEKKRGPYDRVASGEPSATDEKVKVYTNADLAKLTGIVEEADAKSAKGEAGEPGTPKPGAEKVDPAKQDAEKPDPLAWLQKRQAAQQEHSVALAAAEAAVVAARQRVTDLEKQLLATRNPFSARPTLSDEEKEKRRTSGETAAQRNKRNQESLDQAREAVKAAEAELTRVRAARP